eukprot:6200670-Pleurochrysis_carterae.AAC.4
MGRDGDEHEVRSRWDSDTLETIARDVRFAISPSSKGRVGSALRSRTRHSVCDGLAISSNAFRPSATT